MTFISFCNRIFLGLGLLVFRLKKITSQASLEKRQEGSLEIRDTRTGISYKICISNNAIEATDLRMISTAGWNRSPLEHYSKGLKVLDMGFQNTAVCKSRITHIDGNLGKIQFRQYSLDYLLEHHDFIEVAYLLIWGHLPSCAETQNFEGELFKQSNPPDIVIEVVRSFPRGTPNFLIIVAGLSAWAAYSADHIPIHTGKNIYLGNPDAVDSGIIRTMSALSVVIALTSCHQQGKQFRSPDARNSFVCNQLLMMGIVNSETGKPDSWAERQLNKLWIIYADHEMTNSTAAFLHVTSTLADPISGCMASLLSASGPLHAGAIDLAYRSFQQIGSKENVAKLIADVKAKKQRLFGYGHRIYKTVDPRIYHLRKMMDDLAVKTASNPLLSIAMEIDRIASQDTYFTSRNLKANADLYGCFVFSALGFEPEIITAAAAMARSSGVMAHWREAMSDRPNIWRPQQVFTGVVL